MAGRNENGVGVAEPPQDDRHDDRGRSARTDDAATVTVTGGRSFGGMALTVVLAAVFGTGGGGLLAALRPASAESRSAQSVPEIAKAQEKLDAKLDAILARPTQNAPEVAKAQEKLDGKLDAILDGQRRVENRLTALESQGLAALVERIDQRLRRSEEEIAALRALEGRK